ncbi:hypothetical protein Xcc3_16550 [Xanthomonas campestris pv. campestris]|nr:hypothetical protein Xcc1_16180 [Xanthomonas campestris pv. campestris]BBK00348.1 hypothetical protein Xcc3_16550 [Xanthomonas campestris pv. campestris]
MPKAGTATANTIANTATVTINSISVKPPRCLTDNVRLASLVILTPNIPDTTVPKAFACRHKLPTSGKDGQLNG